MRFCSVTGGFDCLFLNIKLRIVLFLVFGDINIFLIAFNVHSFHMLLLRNMCILCVKYDITVDNLFLQHVYMCKTYYPR